MNEVLGATLGISLIVGTLVLFYRGYKTKTKSIKVEDGSGGPDYGGSEYKDRD